MDGIKYFDHAATTRVRKEVLQEMLPFFSIEFGNPSASYSLGRKAKKKVEEARKRTAIAINASPKEIYFTGCGSESNNIAIKGIAYANRKKGNHIITTSIEHPAVLNTCKALEKEGFDVTYLGVNSDGLISTKELEYAIRKNTILISVMFANNEIGTIQEVEQIGRIAKRNNIYFHTDAIQAIGNCRIDVKRMNIDILSISAHKFYGPKGVGGIYIKTGTECHKLQDGGHQEMDKRAGTENVPGIVGLGKAIEMAYGNFEKYNKRIVMFRDYFISEIEKRVPHVKINGHRTKRLSGNSNISFESVRGEELLFELDRKGICVSTGSACSSGSKEPSHVLLEIGLSKNMANGALRVTMGEENTKEDVIFLVNAVVETVEKLRNL